MRSVSLFVVLYLFWLSLSGQFHSTYLLCAGAVCCALVTYIARRMDIVDEEGHPIEVVARFLAYLPWLLWQIVVANIDVARRVWSPNLPISPRFVEVPHDTKTQLGAVTFANSITLTPGTVTVTVGPDKILVHALTEGAAEALLQGDMLERVKKTERGHAK